MEDLEYPLSSKLTFIYKFLPISAFCFFILAAVSDLPDQITSPFVLKLLLFLVFAGTVGIVAIRFALPLKVAYLRGNKLVVSNFLTKIEIPLKNINLVDGPDGSNWRVITIYLDHESRFGDRITFVPGFFRATSVANYLQENLDRIT